MNEPRTLGALLPNVDLMGYSLGTSDTRWENIHGYGTDVYSQTLPCGVPVSVWVAGDGDTVLNVFVYDEDNNLIECDEKYSDTCALSWTPDRTGNFRIEVKNQGYDLNCYNIWTE